MYVNPVYVLLPVRQMTWAAMLTVSAPGPLITPP